MQSQVKSFLEWFEMGFVVAAIVMLIPIVAVVRKS